MGEETYLRACEILLVGRQMEVDLGRRPAEEGQVTEGHKELMEMGRPKSLPSKGPEVVMERSIEARAPDRGLGVSGELEGEMIGSQMGSPSPVVNLIVCTNEALLEEASRYSDHSLLFVFFGEAVNISFFYSIWSRWGKCCHG